MITSDNAHALPLGSLGMYLGAYLGKVRSRKGPYFVFYNGFRGLYVLDMIPPKESTS
jgi:hypothetical protein